MNLEIQTKVIVAGGRDFDNYELLSKILDKFISEQDNHTIISGGAKCADELGVRYARHNNISLIIKPANWNLYGKKAGHIRNIEMVNIATDLIAFWDGRYKGTKHIIRYAQSLNIPVKIIKYP